jgi:ribosomal protein L18
MRAPKPHILKLFLSNKYTYAQILRKSDGNVLAAASTIEKDLRKDCPSTSDKPVRSFPCCKKLTDTLPFNPQG